MNSYGSLQRRQRSLKKLFRTNSHHRLFGNPLSQLSTEEDLIPKPIQDILTQLFRKGPTTTGIFRKSALQRTVKQVRQFLDTGKEVELSEKSAVVLATVLKEFFRSLPDCLICSELYEELLSTKSLPNNQQRIEQVKRLFERLPKEHYDITMKFTCALYHIQRFSDRNNMNSYNLSICVSPSIMWPPSNIKIHYGEQTSGSSDFVCFLIDNYLEIFSLENEYILGNDSDIEIDDGPGEDSDSGNDQVIYNCQCPQYSPKFANDVEDESENELTTPVISPHEVNIQSAFAHSDSSIGTNESDDKTNFRYNMSNISLMPDKVGISKSSPSSPSTSRHNLLEKNSAKSHSDLNECDVNEHYQRKLLKQNRHKRVLSSTTTSAQLIEHKRVIADTNNNSNLTENKFNTEQTSFQNGKPFRSLSDTLPVIKKQVISQPIIQHFATEFYATPNVIFHSVDRRRQPAAPSYEEHIQKTQRQRPAPTNLPSKPVMKGKGRIIQHVDDYQATAVTALIINDKEKNSLLDNPTNKKIIKTKQEDVSTNMKTVSSVQSSNFPVRKTSHQNKLVNSSIVPNNSTSTNRNFQQINDIYLDPSKIEIAEVSVVKSPIKINRLPVAPKPILKVAKKVDVVTSNYYDGSFNSRNNEKESSSSTSSISTTLSACSTSDLPDNAFLSAPNSPSPLGTSPQSNSPFLLKFKNDDIKKDTSNDFVDENKGQSLHLQKTMLTKAPKKIDQLTARVGNEATPFRTKHISSRELKRTKIRLRSEVRDAFNDGYFVCNNNREDRKHHIAPKTGSSLPIKGMKMTLNGQVNDNRKIKSPWLQNNNNKENIAKLNEKNFIEKKTSDDGYHGNGGDGYTKEDESYV